MNGNENFNEAGLLLALQKQMETLGIDIKEKRESLESVNID
jgi:hypothetical protein